MYIESQKNIAVNKNKQGNFEDGEKKLIKLIEEYDFNQSLKIALADLYRLEKKYFKAIKEYSKLFLNKDERLIQHWRIFYLRGICYERVGEWDLAEKDFLNSLKLKPDSPQVLNYLAYGWLERDLNIEKALTMLNNAYSDNPESFHILDSLAWAYFKINQHEKALELMEQVIVMAPGEAISLDHLADIYFAVNRKREALFFWKQALDLARPEDMITDSLIKKLEKKLCWIKILF